MANTIASPYMNLQIPVPSVDPGPQWATDLNSCLSLIDSHDHSTGQGVQITPSGLNINSDLSIGENNIQDVTTVRLTSQASAITGADPNLCCIYAVGNDLYYNDGAGNQVRITQSGSVAGSSGTITGLPSGTASASYVSVSSKFVFQSATNTAADVDGRSFLLRNSAASSMALTLSPPAAMGSNYTITLPPIPSGNGLVLMDTSGNQSAINPTDEITLHWASNTLTVKNLGVGTAQLANLAVTAAKIANATITTTQIASATITGSNIASNVNLAGNTVQENGKNVVVSSTNATTSLAVIRGWVNATGTITAGEGFTITRSSVGVYQVNFSINFASFPGVTMSAVSSVAGGILATVTGINLNRVDVNTVVPATGVSADSDFSFVVVGPR